ncbi:MAG: tRNA pseudouridine38-40 synthase [Chloroflexi bacterium]|nr:MAG: tRNA pseudouridine38-40 synthase [Chloroflexota bacterium]MBA4374612.1 tRNA pseudouridine(38-40) synthase TruA [Anaerolinea sp.]
MARYQLILAYDGTDFSGFQRQGETRTVQKVVETVLTELGWNEETILFAGRTDSGVHASGQVVVFSLDWQHENETLVNALNAKLPSDVSVQSISRVEAEFHPRYDASSRCYAYTIYHLPYRQPLLERFAWRIWPPLNGALLSQAADTVLGWHDFSAFGRAMKPGSSTVREIFESRWTSTDLGWRYEIRANAFLYHMVRRLVFLQVQFAKGNLTIGNLTDGLIGNATMKPGLAPSNGLVLTKVLYEDRMQGSVD